MTVQVKEHLTELLKEDEGKGRRSVNEYMKLLETMNEDERQPMQEAVLKMTAGVLDELDEMRVRRT